MRFAWQRKQANGDNAPKPRLSAPQRLVLIAYNVIWWIPIVLPFTGAIDYSAGFLAFLAITLIRAGANVYRNNVLTIEQAETFPLRSP